MVGAAVDHFLEAFENLDITTFVSCFAEDATVFYPDPEPPARVTGRMAIEARFEQVFAAIRAEAEGGPPYHRLVPVDLAVQPVADDVAVVTFHLASERRTGRRTLVLTRAATGEWRIVHLHASNRVT